MLAIEVLLMIEKLVPKLFKSFFGGQQVVKHPVDNLPPRGDLRAFVQVPRFFCLVTFEIRVE